VLWLKEIGKLVEVSGVGKWGAVQRDRESTKLKSQSMKRELVRMRTTHDSEEHQRDFAPHLLLRLMASALGKIFRHENVGLLR
jgi:hypothetical protein